jgi:hypothetical protein
MTSCCQNQQYILLDPSILVIPDDTFLGINWTVIQHNFILLTHSIGCTNIIQFIFGGPVTSIGLRAFQGCTSLTSISLPVSLVTLGDRAFLGNKL